MQQHFINYYYYYNSRSYFRNTTKWIYPQSVKYHSKHVKQETGTLNESTFKW